MQIRQKLSTIIFFLCPLVVAGQQVSAPEPQTGIITGTVTDTEDSVIPGAVIAVDGAGPGDHQVATADDGGYFTIKDLHPAVSYRIVINAKGFAGWSSPPIILTPGQQSDLGAIKLRVASAETSVTAILPEQLALEQVKAEEKQRVLGVIPNFYVAYDQNTMALTTKLKFQLALKASTDVVTFAGVGFLAGIDQAADRPDYVQGAKGYGQRFGAVYADGVSGILIGGAILPSLLHQDPRYFYQGTGTKKSRALHAISSPFRAKGDDGRWQFNYSSIGGDLASGALSNLYYPQSNRGPSLVFTTVATVTAGRMVNALAQEFILSRFTTHSKIEP